MFRQWRRWARFQKPAGHPDSQPCRRKQNHPFLSAGPRGQGAIPQSILWPLQDLQTVVSDRHARCPRACARTDKPTPRGSSCASSDGSVISPVSSRCASGRGPRGCCSMVQACLVCSRVHKGSLAARAAAADMDKQDKPSPSAKKHVRLQERRGSNVSLVLDMSSLGNVEPIQAVCTPRDITLKFLRTSSHVLSKQELQQHAQSLAQLQEEFSKIPPNFVSPEELEIPGRAFKDRYKTILPNPESRVCLRRAGSQEEESYINANYITGYAGRPREYIATQGPLLNTVTDFWQMVWQEEAPLIVMITELQERKEKCVHYWPEKEGTYGPFTVRVQGVSEAVEYVLRDLSIQLKKECRKVKHILFPSWPDQQTPESAKPLLHLVSKVEEALQTAASPGPIVVHCSAGIGRTGCFIATRMGCQQLRDTGQVDILGTVCRLRIDRGGMIQTSEQYQFLHHTLALYASQLPEGGGC